MKRYATGAILLLLMAALLWDNQTAAQAVRDGLNLCARSVIPALFPFFVAVSFFTDLGLADSLGRFLAPVTGPLLGCSGAGSAAFLLGLLGGYPVGARTVGELYASGAVDRGEAEHLLSFCNNCGPSFVVGIAGVGCFHSAVAGVSLYLIHVSAALLVARLRRHPNALPARRTVRAAPPPLTVAFIRSVTQGAEAMVHICAFVVFFMTVLRLAVLHTGLSHPLPLGLVELTGGVLRLPPDRAGFLMAAGLIGWGGLSVHCQTAAVLHGTDLSLKPYLAGKLLQAGISVILAIPVSLWLF
ncbi:MAG: sporulation protein [Oscillospiraceae bacterium]|nr:sporulation protein [Oscillospiraceae bacterium]